MQSLAARKNCCCCEKKGTRKIKLKAVLKSNRSTCKIKAECKHTGEKENKL